MMKVLLCVKVVSGDHVIDEGDDGDNFYVIDKSVLLALHYVTVVVYYRQSVCLSSYHVITHKQIHSVQLTTYRSVQ